MKKAGFVLMIFVLVMGVFVGNTQARVADLGREDRRSTIPVYRPTETSHVPTSNISKKIENFLSKGQYDRAVEQFAAANGSDPEIIVLLNQTLSGERFGVNTRKAAQMLNDLYETNSGLVANTLDVMVSENKGVRILEILTKTETKHPSTKILGIKITPPWGGREYRIIYDVTIANILKIMSPEGAAGLLAEFDYKTAARLLTMGNFETAHLAELLAELPTLDAIQILFAPGQGVQGGDTIISPDKIIDILAAMDVDKAKEVLVTLRGSWTEEQIVKFFLPETEVANAILEAVPWEDKEATVMALWLISVADARPDNEAVNNMVCHNLIGLGQEVVLEPLFAVIANRFSSYEDGKTYEYEANYSRHTSEMAIRILSEIGGLRAARFLISIWSDDHSLRGAIGDALIKMSENNGFANLEEPVLKQITTKSIFLLGNHRYANPLRGYAFRILANIGEPAVEYLSTALNEDVRFPRYPLWINWDSEQIDAARVTVAQILGEIGGSRAAEQLVYKMNYNRVPALRIASMQGLAKIVRAGTLGDLDESLMALMREQARANANIRGYSDIALETAIRTAAGDLLAALDERDEYIYGHKM